jgi:hypothetical protein
MRMTFSEEGSLRTRHAEIQNDYEPSANKAIFLVFARSTRVLDRRGTSRKTRCHDRFF